MPRRGPLAPGAPARRALERGLPFAVPAWRAVKGRIDFWREDKPDRKVLEGPIFGALRARDDVRRILFVGVDWYTRRYPRRFADRELWTIEPIPGRARHGARGRHVVGSVVELDRHFDAASFDAIVLNGVLGYGLDAPGEQARTFDQLARALRPGGLLIVGWNDVDGHRPARPVPEMAAGAGLDPTPLPPLAEPRHSTSGDARHTFDFYRRPGPGPRRADG
jgi:SAM-dependent methyltransferase